MPAQSSPNEDLRERVLLLCQAVELFTQELDALTNRQEAEAPELKRKKVVLASRFRKVNWQSPPAGWDAFDLRKLKDLVTRLESQSRDKIQSELDALGQQIVAMQDLHQYWRESLSVSFQRFYEAQAPA